MPERARCNADLSARCWGLWLATDYFPTLRAFERAREGDWYVLLTVTTDRIKHGTGSSLRLSAPQSGSEHLRSFA